TYAGGRGGVPRGETVKRTRESRGRQPFRGGSGAKPLRPKESVDRHSSEDFSCRPACEDRETRSASTPSLELCEDREMRAASTPSLELRFWVGGASDANGRERRERNAARRRTAAWLRAIKGPAPQRQRPGARQPTWQAWKKSCGSLSCVSWRAKCPI